MSPGPPGSLSGCPAKSPGLCKINTDHKKGTSIACIVASLADFKGGECIVKRVIATEGQIVDIDFERGVVFVDGEEIDEPYIHSYTYNQQGVSFPLIVQKGHVFVLGDNRESSLDSRSYEIGQIDRREILGKAIFLLIPGDNDGLEKPRYDRIGVIK